MFRDTRDPDFRLLLAAIEDVRMRLEAIRRFNMPRFRPAPEYVREMQRYGILSPDLREGDVIDVYETDRRYWRSMWHRPAHEP